VLLLSSNRMPHVDLLADRQMSLQVAALCQSLLSVFVDSKDLWNAAVNVINLLWARLSYVAAAAGSLACKDAECVSDAQGRNGADGETGPGTPLSNSEQVQAEKASAVIMALKTVLQSGAASGCIKAPLCSNDAPGSCKQAFFKDAYLVDGSTLLQVPELLCHFGAAAACPGGCIAKARAFDGLAPCETHANRDFTEAGQLLHQCLCQVAAQALGAQRQLCACQRDVLQDLMWRDAPLQYAPVLQRRANDQLFVVARGKECVAAMARVTLVEGDWGIVCDSTSLRCPAPAPSVFISGDSC
jgi:hypothetical protein